MTNTTFLPNPTLQDENNNREVDRQHAMTCRLRDRGWWWAILYPSMAGYWHMFTRKTLTPVACGLGSFMLGVVILAMASESTCNKDKSCEGGLGVLILMTYVPSVKAGIELYRRKSKKYFTEN